MHFPLVFLPSFLLPRFLNRFANPLANTYPRALDTFTIYRVFARMEIHRSSYVFTGFTREHRHVGLPRTFFGGGTSILRRQHFPPCRDNSQRWSFARFDDAIVSRRGPGKSIRDRKCAMAPWYIAARAQLFACSKITSTFARAGNVKWHIKSLSVHSPLIISIRRVRREEGSQWDREKLLALRNVLIGFVT